MVHPLHPRLRPPVMRGGRPLTQLGLDLTVYLEGPSVEEFAFLVRLYERVCPIARLKSYAIAETVDWDDIRDPILTKQGYEAARRGERFPFLAPVRTRIERGRDFELQLWDGQEVDTFHFNCRRVRDEAGAKHAFVRFLFPLDIDLQIPQDVAEAIADNVGLRSGHGGLVGLYDPWNKYDAFSMNYGRAKRFWGLDLEDLNTTLPRMSDAIKGVQWLTLVGRSWLSDGAVEASVGALTGKVGVTVANKQHAVVVRAGDAPSDGDQHRKDPELEPYFEVARALESITLNDHPDFLGDGFARNANTVGWLRRFIDPDGWR